jgi:hypothetical protein
MAIPIPRDVRQLLGAPNYVHPSPCALMAHRATGWCGWGSRTSTSSCAPPMRSGGERHPPRSLVALSVTDMANPYRMAAIRGRVVEVRPDEGCRYMDPISFKCTGAPFPSRGRIACAS